MGVHACALCDVESRRIGVSGVSGATDTPKKSLVLNDKASVKRSAPFPAPLDVGCGEMAGRSPVAGRKPGRKILPALQYKTIAWSNYPTFFREVPLFTGRSSPNLVWTSRWGPAEKWRGLGGFAPHSGVRGGPQSGKIDIFGGFSPLAPKPEEPSDFDLPLPLALPHTRPAPLSGPFLLAGKKCCGGLNVADHVVFAKMAKSHH